MLDLEATDACGLAPEKAGFSGGEESTKEMEMAWNANCDQGNGSVHFTDYKPPGYEDGSCNCQGEISYSSRTFSEKDSDLCGFACRHWASSSREKDMSSLLQGQEDCVEDSVEDDVTSKPKEELPDCTRLSGGRKVARQQKHRSSAKEKGEGCFTLSGGKHRQIRKRTDGGRHHVWAELLKHLEGLASFCVSCFKLFISLIVQVTHRCGEGVEASGRLFYSCCSFSPRDLDTIRNSMQTWIQHTRLGCRKLIRQLSSWVSLTYRLLKMLCAVFFLVLMLFLGSLRLSWRVSKSALVSILGRFTNTRHGALLLSVLDLPKIWALFKESRTCKWVVGFLHKWHGGLWLPKGLRTNRLRDTAFNGSPGGSGKYQPDEEVTRLLAMALIPEEELNPFQVLGLEATASDAELKRAYRHLAVLVSIPFGPGDDECLV